MGRIKNLFERIIYGVKADSESYIGFLRKSGLKIGEGCKIYSPRNTHIDSTYFLIELGNNVRITEGVTILCHDASVYTLDFAGIRGGYAQHRGHLRKL